MERFSNNAITCLAVAVPDDSSAVTLCVSTSDSFPLQYSKFPNTGNFRVLIDAEIMCVCGVVAAGQFCVLAGGRGAESSGGCTHSIGAYVYQALTRDSLDMAIRQGGTDCTTGACACGAKSYVGGGVYNCALFSYDAILNGLYNTAAGCHSLIGNGCCNYICNNAPESTILNGTNNTINNSLLSTISNGYCNYINSTGGYYNAILNGLCNTASGYFSTIANGGRNAAACNYSTIINGACNTASGCYFSTIINGINNAATGKCFATVLNANYSTASECFATVINGLCNTASGCFSTVSNGYSNIASGDYSTILNGLCACANLYGEEAKAIGKFSSRGDAQHIKLLARNTTTNSTLTELYLDGSAAHLTIPSDTTWQFDISIVGRDIKDGSTGVGVAWQIQGVVANSHVPAVAIIGTNTTTILTNIPAWTTPTVIADDVNKALSINVTGHATETVYWLARIDILQLTGYVA